MAITKLNPDQLVFTGNTLTFLSPDAKLITIREINGEDEDILTRQGNMKDGTALIKFLAGIILEISGEKGPITEFTVSKLKSRTLYYTLFKARVHSHGWKATFKHTFQGDTEPIGFEEDLKVYDWDFGNGAPPRLGEPGYDDRIIQPYPEVGNDYMEGITSSKIEFRMKYLTGEAEKSVLGRDPDTLAINEKLRIREFEVKMPNGHWQLIENFAPFSVRDMKEFRKMVDTYDGPFDAIVTLVHPTKKITEQVSLFMLSDFFLPTV